jgi:hypothetical protein
MSSPTSLTRRRANRNNCFRGIGRRRRWMLKRPDLCPSPDAYAEHRPPMLSALNSFKLSMLRSVKAVMPSLLCMHHLAVMMSSQLLAMWMSRRFHRSARRRIRSCGRASGVPSGCYLPGDAAGGRFEGKSSGSRDTGMPGHAGKHIHQLSLRIDVVHLCRDD